MTHPLRPALVAALVLTVAATAGCGREHAESPESAGEAVQVTTMTVTAGGEGEVLILPARIEARQEVTIAARIPARLTRFLFAEGESFAPGATLVEFSAPETREALAAAGARREAAVIRRDQAARQEARLDSLHALGVASLREFELAQAERHAAWAEYAAAESGLAELSAATAVPAPFAGVVVRHHVDPGASVGPGMPLLDIRSREAGHIVAPIPESAVTRLAGAEVSFQVGNSPFHPAVLDRLDGMTDFTTRTRTARFRPAAAGTHLEPGVYARVRIAGAGGGEPGAAARVRVPVTALVRRGSLSGVFIVRDGKAVLRWIRPGAEIGGYLEVLAGLESGAVIALEPKRLADGRPVEVAR